MKRFLYNKYSISNTYRWDRFNLGTTTTRNYIGRYPVAKGYLTVNDQNPDGTYRQISLNVSDIGATYYSNYSVLSDGRGVV